MWYASRKNRPLRKKTVIFADSNSNSLPESMIPLFHELKKRGFKPVPMLCNFSETGLKNQLLFMRRFMKAYATAGGVVVCNYFVPLHGCRKRPQTRVVQLWHSCGAGKKFGWAAKDDIPPDFKGSVSRNIDLVTVSSEACIPVFEQAFRLKKGIARATGVSRTDILLDSRYKQRCRDKLHRLHPETDGKKLLLYLPTFRGGADKAQSVGHEAVNELGKNLDGCYVCVRMHPRVKNGVVGLSDMTTNELLCCADMLITDYSSAMFEFALMDKPMILWCPDLDEYLSKRDMYIDLKKDAPCPVVTSADKLLSTVTSELDGFESGAYSAFLKKYLSACDGKATERIADFLTNGR